MLLTERSWIHEAPECVVARLQDRAGVTCTGNKLEHEGAEDVRDDLKEELADRNRLGAEILCGATSM